MEQREFAKQLRHLMTESENKLWRHLRAHRLGGEKFGRQQPIGPYAVDFVHFLSAACLSRSRCRMPLPARPLQSLRQARASASAALTH